MITYIRNLYNLLCYCTAKFIALIMGNITGTNVETLRNEFPLSPRKGRIVSSHSNIYGKKIRLNNKEIALLSYKDNFYAVDEKCPHMGMFLILIRKCFL